MSIDEAQHIVDVCKNMHYSHYVYDTSDYNEAVKVLKEAEQ